MNYRHAYHAGNAADCLKHALLVALLTALRRKPAAFTVLDTHAGTGAYDLTSAEAAATGEWRSGIGRLRQAHPPTLAEYLELVPDEGVYPGSPLIARRLLRLQDRLVCCELHPNDAAVLRRRFAADPQVAVHLRNGYEALRGLLPPPTTRGLVLIDPPYEQPDEYEQVAAGLQAAARRFPAGVLAAWVPIKHLAPVRALHASLSGLRDTIWISLTLRPPLDPARLNGSGLIVVRPPFGYEQRAAEIADALCSVLAEAGGAWAVERLTDE